MTTVTHDYDVLIVGGGLVGASLACALGGQPLRVGVVEAFPFGSRGQPSYDDRSIALAYGSRRIFEGMQLWPALSPSATAIKRIHISDRGRFGMTRLDAAREGFDALGYVIENRELGAVLTAVLSELANVDLLCPARLTSLTVSNHGALAVIDSDGQQRTLTAQLVVGADGGNSVVRSLLGIETRTWDYDQTAVIANVSTDRPHDHIAYERFTDSGPLALLPLSNQRWSLVWTVNHADAEAIMALDDRQFLESLQQRFGRRAGTFVRCGKRHAYPLSLVRTLEDIRPHVAIIGNAAHTLHPIAGQGFNLGIRDVAALAQVLAEAVSTGDSPGSMEVLQRYHDWRRRDQRHVTALTDSLVRLFSNAYPPLVVGRNLGLIAMDLFPPLKRRMMRQTMGIAGRLPRLARGLSL